MGMSQAQGIRGDDGNTNCQQNKDIYQPNLGNNKISWALRNVFFHISNGVFREFPASHSWEEQKKAMRHWREPEEAAKNIVRSAYKRPEAELPSSQGFNS